HLLESHAMASKPRNSFWLRWTLRFSLLVLTCCAAPAPSHAEDQSFPGYFRNWFSRSDKSKEEQPHWMTPILTVTPRLEQEVRFDVSWQTQTNGGGQANYGAQKGLELIPTENTEIIIGLPSYQ